MVRRETLLDLKPGTQVHSFLQTNGNLDCQVGADGYDAGVSSGGGKVDQDVYLLQARGLYEALCAMGDNLGNPQ